MIRLVFRIFSNIFGKLGQGNSTKSQRTPISKNKTRKMTKKMSKIVKTLFPRDLKITQNHVFWLSKKPSKNEPWNSIPFWHFFSDLGSPRRRFCAILGTKNVARRMFYRCFSENGDFVKIELPLWREHNFERPHPPKIDPEGDSEHKKDKNA